MLTLLLGAGFSKWAADLPVGNQLFDFAIEPFGIRELDRLKLVKSIKEAWDKNNPEGLDEQFIAYALKFEEKERKAVLWYIVRRLSEPFIWKEYHAQRWRRHVMMIDENRRFRLEGIQKSQGFVQRVRSSFLSGIVTTNYDMIMEYSLGTKGFNYGVPGQILSRRGPYPVSQWKNPVKLEGNIALAKIRGSISWDNAACYTDGRRGLTGNALIVAPTPEKKPPESLKFVWDLAGRMLKNSNHLLVFGFAFNPYDEAVLDLLKKSGDNIESVLGVDIYPRLERIKSIWPDANISTCLPPPEGNMCIKEWIEKLQLD